MSRRVICGAVLAVAAAVAAIGLVGCSSREGQPVTVLRGKTTLVNPDGVNIFFEGKRVAGPKFDFIDEEGGWNVGGAQWSDGNTWHDSGKAPCIGKPAPQPIEMGVIETATYKDAPGVGVVAWLKCL